MTAHLADPHVSDLITALPELFLLGAAMVVLIVDLFVSEANRSWMFKLSLATIAIAAGWVAQGADGAVHLAFAGHYVVDPLAVALKLLACVATLITLVFAQQYARDRDIFRSELMVLALMALLGQFVMISAHSLLTVYLGLELMSLALYALVALRRDFAASTEAAIKYFVLGALSSGFLLYGMSMVYGATGTLDLGEVAKSAASGIANKQILLLGVVFLVTGIGFKISAAPFHMWAPDVYEGSPSAVTLMVAGAPKLAAFAITIRLLVEALPAVSADWQQMFAVLAVLSLAVGNLTAIAQTNLKRMLAYSAIAQMGFVMLGFMAGAGQNPAIAYGSAMYYTVIYVLSTLGTFGVILLLARSGFECDRIDDLAGLNQRSPWVAFVMLLLMFSLAGIPPTVGFYAKLVVLEAVIGAGYIGVAIFAVMASLIGAFYYLRVVKTMYFDTPTTLLTVQGGGDARALLAITGGSIIAFGIFGDGLMRLCFDTLRLSAAAS